MTSTKLGLKDDPRVKIHINSFHSICREPCIFRENLELRIQDSSILPCWGNRECNNSLSSLVNPIDEISDYSWSRINGIPHIAQTDCSWCSCWSSICANNKIIKLIESVIIDQINISSIRSSSNSIIWESISWHFN